MDSSYLILFKYAIGQIDDIDPSRWVLHGMRLILLTVKLFQAVILYRNTAQYWNDGISAEVHLPLENEYFQNMILKAFCWIINEKHYISQEC